MNTHRSVKPKVSVVVPNYNHSKYLKERIDSILCQSYQNFELILLDDHSSDDSLQVLSQYGQHPKVTHFVVNEMNSGSTFHQWNKGVELSKGELIWIAESDDRASPQFLKQLVKVFETKSQIGLAYCQSYEISENGSVRGDLSWLSDGLSDVLWKQDFFMDGKSFVSEYMYERNTIPNVSACLFRKKAMLDAGRAPVNFKYNGDWFYYAQLLKNWNVAFKSECLNYFRCHQDSTRRHELVATKRRAMVELFVTLRYMRQHTGLALDRYTSSRKRFSTFKMPFLDQLIKQIRLYDPPKFVIYGAGILGAQLYQRLKDIGFAERVTLFIDKKAEKYAVPDIDTKKVLSLADYINRGSNDPIVIASQHFVDEICSELSKAKLNRVISNQQPIILQNDGVCYCCNQAVTFIARDPWLRDHYLCNSCGSIPRERALMYCIEKYCPDWRSLAIHESSPGLRGASNRLKKEGQYYFASQFFGDIKLGDYHNSYRCEDLADLTFDDNSIDLHISQDVMEHVFNPAQVFSEIERTLKPGGFYIFTTPLVNKQNPSTICAELIDGEVIHHCPPEYHGNPIDENGSLVTMNWGYDITDIIYKTSGLMARIVDLDNLEYGIRAEYNEVIVCYKK